MENLTINFDNLVNSENVVDFEAVLKFAPLVFKKLIFAKKYIELKVENVSENEKTIVMYRKYKDLTSREALCKFSEAFCLLSCFMDYWLKIEFNKFCKNK